MLNACQQVKGDEVPVTVSKFKEQVSPKRPKTAPISSEPENSDELGFCLDSETNAHHHPKKVPSRNQLRKQQFEDTPFQIHDSAFHFNRVAEAWFPGTLGREALFQGYRFRNNPRPPLSKDPKQDLTLKYGRFPKVLRMKQHKTDEIQPELRPKTPTRAKLKTRPESGGRPKGSSSNSCLRPVSKEAVTNPRSRSRPLRNRPSDKETPHPPISGGGEKVRRRLKTVGQEPLITKRLGTAIGTENWSLADRLLYGNFMGSEEQGDEER